MLTYGWALILIATIVGILVLIISTPSGYVCSSIRIVSSAEPKKESETTASAGIGENPAQNEAEANAATIAKAQPMQEKQSNSEQETAPSALPAENNAAQETTIEGNAKQTPTGFASLAQNALNAVIVIVAGVIVLLGKLLFK